MAISIERKRKLKTAAIVLAPIVGLMVFWAVNVGSGIPHFLARARAVQAHAELNGVDLAVTRMVTDAGVGSVRGLLAHPETIDEGSDQAVLERHSAIVYDLLVHGKNASVELDPEARRKLGDEYMDLKEDPWGAGYVFYIPRDVSVAGALQDRIAQSYNPQMFSADPNVPGQGPVIVGICRGKDGELACLGAGGATGPGDDISNVNTKGVFFAAYN